MYVNAKKTKSTKWFEFANFLLQSVKNAIHLHEREEGRKYFGIPAHALNSQAQPEIIGRLPAARFIIIVRSSSLSFEMHNLSISQCFLSPRMAFHAVIDEEPSSISLSLRPFFQLGEKCRFGFALLFPKKNQREERILLLHFVS